jgi:uridine kinase
MSARVLLIARIGRAVDAVPPPGITRVAVDGVDGAGKTMFGDELALELERLGRPVIRASIDGFHNPREVRYRRGRASPEGFFEDSYDYELLRAFLLDPLGPDGDGRYRAVAFDHRTDSPVAVAASVATVRTVLVLDGIFLHRPELRSYWDFSVFLRASFDVTYPRLAARGDGSADPLAESNRRYLEGQRLYLGRCSPEKHASVVIDNNDLEAPHIVRASPPHGLLA